MNACAATHRRGAAPRAQLAVGAVAVALGCALSAAVAWIAHSVVIRLPRVARPVVEAGTLGGRHRALVAPAAVSPRPLLFHDVECRVASPRTIAIDAAGVNPCLLAMLNALVDVYWIALSISVRTVVQWRPAERRLSAKLLVSTTIAVLRESTT